LYFIIEIHSKVLDSTLATVPHAAGRG